MEALNVTDGDIDGLLDIGSELHELGGERSVDDRGGQGSGLLELVGILENAGIAVLANILDNGLDQTNDGVVGLLRGTLEELLDFSDGC